MPRAYILIRDAPWYRREAFGRGLMAAGYDMRTGTAPARPGDALVIWNRYAGWHETAVRFEREGGTVICAENGYLGAGGTEPKFDVHPGGPKPGHYYALALGWHNGRGQWPAGGPERFAALQVELKPWRTAGRHILVCPNRSFGVGAQVMPADWGQRCAGRLRAVTARRVVVRDHPGNSRPARPLRSDLEGAWACVVWSSGSAVHALAAGIPTFIEAPYHVLKGAGASGTVDAPVMPERLPHFERMAWAQWQCREIESGEPFRHLLRAAGQAQVAARP